MEWVYDSNQLQLWVLYKTVQGCTGYMIDYMVITTWSLLFGIGMVLYQLIWGLCGGRMWEYISERP